MFKQALYGAAAAAAVTLGPDVMAWASSVADVLVYWTVPASSEIAESAHAAYQGLIYAPLVAVGAYVAFRAKDAQPAPQPVLTTTEET